MSMQLINAIYFLLVAAFGMYSMHRNDEVVTNKWLFLCGWFLWGCMIVLTANSFLDYFVDKGYVTTAKIDIVFRGFKDITTSSFSTFIYSIGFIFYNMYLFSLRKRCMEAELIPRTFKIWIIRSYRKAFKRHLYHKPKKQIK